MSWKWVYYDVLFPRCTISNLLLSYSLISNHLSSIAACSFSSMLAFECLLALESILASIQKRLDCLEGDCTASYSVFNPGILFTLCSRLGKSAEKLLRQSWDDQDLDDGWKSKVRPFFLIHLIFYFQCHFDFYLKPLCLF